MQALEFWKEVILDKSRFLESFIEALNTAGTRYCVIGGQAVNAYVEPLVSLDLDIVVAVDQLSDVVAGLANLYEIKTFPHSLNLSQAGSDLRVQIQTDHRYDDFVERAAIRNVLGLALPVASLEDVLAGKLWAVQDPARRGSKRQKDLADIARILESYPHLRSQVPQDILSRID